MANPDTQKPSGDQPPALAQATSGLVSPTFDMSDSPTFELTSSDDDEANAWFFGNATGSGSGDQSGSQPIGNKASTAEGSETKPPSVGKSPVPEPQNRPSSSSESQQASAATAVGGKPAEAVKVEADDKEADEDSEDVSVGSLFDEDDFSFDDDMFKDEPDSVVNLTGIPAHQTQRPAGAEIEQCAGPAMPVMIDSSPEESEAEEESITVAVAPEPDLKQPEPQPVQDPQDNQGCEGINPAALDLPPRRPVLSVVTSGLQFPVPAVVVNDQPTAPALLPEPASLPVPGDGSFIPNIPQQQHFGQAEIAPGLSQYQGNTIQQNSTAQNFSATDGNHAPSKVGGPIQEPLQWFAVLEPMAPVVANQDQPAESDQDAEGEEIEDAEFYAYLNADEDNKSVAAGHTDSTSKDGSEITDPALITYPDLPRPAAWGPHKSAKPVFKYSTRGQWDVGTYYSTKALRFYNARCTRNLTIWLQTTPRCHDRQDSWDRMCRWAGCPDKGNPIRPGFFRCTFDEYSHLTTTGKKNPFHTAGCLHLYCFEQVFDAAKLHRRGRFLLDQREFAAEGNKNGLAVNRPPDRMITAAAFKPWLEKQPASHLIPADCWVPLPHEQSLGHALTVFRARVRPHRPSEPPEKSIESEHGQVMPMAEHKGDLQKLVDALKAAKDLKKKALAGRYLTLEPPTPAGPSNKPKRPSSVVSSTSSLSTLDSDGGALLAPTSSDEEDSTDSEVHDIEAITNMRRRKGKFEYEVKWSGSNTGTWEPEASLQHDLSEKDLRELVRDFAAADRKRAEAKIRGLEDKVAELIETVKQQKFELNRSHKRRRQKVDYTEYSDPEDADIKREVLPLRKKARKSGHAEDAEPKSERKREHHDSKDNSSRKRAKRA